MGSGRSKGLGVVTMDRAFTVSVEPEVEFVRSVAKSQVMSTNSLMCITSPRSRAPKKKSILVTWETVGVVT